MADLDALKAIPIATVAAGLKIRLLTNGRGRCPLPGHEDHNPSFALRFTTNSFRCFACGRHGSVIDLVMEIERLDFTGACRWLRERFGDGVADGRSNPRRMSSRHLSRSSSRRFTAADTELAADPEVFGWLLAQSPLQVSGRSYLALRGISDGTISRFRVGQIGDRASHLREAYALFGGERLKRCGIVAEGRFGPRLVFPSGYLLFPFLEGSAVLYLQARRADNGVEHRWFCPAKLPPPAYNLDALASASRSILICEGVTDVLSAGEMGKDALGLLGANSHIDPAVVAKLKRLNVIVIGDADAPGQKFARTLVDALGASGITAVSRLPPGGANDLNAYLQLRRSEAA
ncbi:MAG: CHC2 zinc finger domain-containing protein [Novosphingobium sp.]